MYFNKLKQIVEFSIEEICHNFIILLNIWYNRKINLHLWENHMNSFNVYNSYHQLMLYPIISLPLSAIIKYFSLIYDRVHC